MALERKKTISAITLHFATEDIYDENGNLIITQGTMKFPKVEVVESIEEDGVKLEGFKSRRIPLTKDQINSELEIEGDALKVVRGLKKILSEQ